MGIVLDMSEWQLNVDWSKVAAQHQAGTIDGVILRVQAGWTHLDAKYKEYVAGCKQYGIPFGTYAYFKGINDADSLKEAESAFINTDPASLCFAVDIEEVTGGNLVTGGQAFVDYLHSKGVKNVGIYSGKNFYDTYNLAAINCDWRWIAAYGANDGTAHTDPNENGETLWQFTSVGHVDGVTTNVDENVEKGFFFTPATPIQVVVPQPAPVPAPVPAAPVSSGRKLFLPAKNIDGSPDNSWTVYKLNCPPVKEPQNIAGHLNPALFGGLTYDIIEDFGGYVFGIQTQSFGHVKIYAAPSTGAIVKNGVTSAPAPTPVYHTVVAGDTVSALAIHYGTTIAQIKAWNNLDANYTIIIGKSIRVK